MKSEIRDSRFGLAGLSRLHHRLGAHVCLSFNNRASKSRNMLNRYAIMNPHWHEYSIHYPQSRLGERLHHGPQPTCLQTQWGSVSRFAPLSDSQSVAKQTSRLRDLSNESVTISSSTTPHRVTIHMLTYMPSSLICTWRLESHIRRPAPGASSAKEGRSR